MTRIAGKLLIILLCAVPWTISAGAGVLRNTDDTGNHIPVRIPLYINSIESCAPRGGVLCKESSGDIAPGYGYTDIGDCYGSEKSSNNADRYGVQDSGSNGLTGNYFLDSSTAAMRLVLGLDN